MLSRAVSRATLSAAILASAPYVSAAESDLPTAGDTSGVSSVLPTVVVSASAGGIAQEVVQAPASISVITRQELESKPYRDLADAISSVPGVITTGGGDHKEISIRGMGSAYTLMLIDGKRVDSRETSRLSDGYGQMNAWTPPISAIERVEVVRGPMSALYGADAMGGVINIITRKVAKVWSGEISSDLLLQQHSASGDAYQGSFFLTGPIKNDLLGLEIYGQHSTRDEDRIYFGYRNSKRDNVTAKLALMPTRDHDVVLEVNHTSQRIRQEPGKSIDPGCVAYTYLGCADPYDKSVETNRFSLSHTGRWSFGTSETYVQQEVFNISPQDIRLKNTAFRTSWAIPMGEHVVTVGVGYDENDLHDRYSNTVTNLYDVKRTQKALFAEEVWQMAESFALTTGVRVDDDDRFGKHWSPRVYGVWTLAPAWTLKGGATSGFKSPELTQVAPGYASLSGVGNIYGNADLKPEKSLNEEIGLSYQEQDRVNASLTLFNNKFKDKITTLACVPGDACYALAGGTGYYGPLAPQTYANVDRATTRGIEATLGLPLTRTISLDASYTYTYSRQDSGAYTGKPLNKLPRHLFAGTLTYRPSDALSGWARMTYRGKDSDNVGGVYAILSPVEAPSYTMFDVGTSYQINRSLGLRAALYNVGDKKIRYGDYGYVEDGRRLWLGMTAKF